MAERQESPPQDYLEIDCTKWELAGEGDALASVAVTTNPDKSAHSFDLDYVNKHGLIKHDVFYCLAMTFYLEITTHSTKRFSAR